MEEGKYSKQETSRNSIGWCWVPAAPRKLFWWGKVTLLGVSFNTQTNQALAPIGWMRTKLTKAHTTQTRVCKLWARTVSYLSRKRLTQYVGLMCHCDDRNLTKGMLRFSSNQDFVSRKWTNGLISWYVSVQMTSGLEYNIKNSLSLTFCVTNENKACIISSKAHVLYLCLKKKSINAEVSLLMPWSILTDEHLQQDLQNT